MASDTIGSLDVSETTAPTPTAPERTSVPCSETPYKLLGPSEIRVVEILPGDDFEQTIQIVLKTVDLQDEPAYDALSYVWNPTDGTIDASKTLESATIKGSEDFPIQLTANLDAAIRYLRQHKPAPSALWIDALCINQDPALERNHQVGLMSKIYSSAEQVLIWLGPPCQDSQFAFETLSSGKLEKCDIDRFIAAVELLLRRDWFGRLWIAQELTLSLQDPVVHHGSQIIDWETFVLSVVVVKDRINGEDDSLHCQYLRTFSTANIQEEDGLFTRQVDPSVPPDDHFASYPPAVMARAETVLQLRDMRNAGFKASFAQRILHTIYLQATDPRDRVYGLLGFSSFHKLSIIPDYKKTFMEVYAEAAMVVLQESFSDYLQFQDRFDTNPSSNRNISWFPDLDLLALTRRSGPTISPPLSVLQTALAKTDISYPMMDFLDSPLRLLTLGRVLGCIKHYGSSELGEQQAHEPLFLDFIEQCGTNIGSENIVSALTGYDSPSELDRKEMILSLEDFLSPKRELDVESWWEETENIKKVIESYSHKLSIFMTDTGIVGVMPRSRPEGLENCIVAGLFGINLPFVLDTTADGDYEMIGMVYLANHTLGDEDFAETIRFRKWSEDESYGSLQEFLII